MEGNDYRDFGKWSLNIDGGGGRGLLNTGLTKRKHLIFQIQIQLCKALWSGEGLRNPYQTGSCLWWRSYLFLPNRFYGDLFTSQRVNPRGRTWCSHHMESGSGDDFCKSYPFLIQYYHNCILQHHRNHTGFVAIYSRKISRESSRVMWWYHLRFDILQLIVCFIASKSKSGQK